MHSEGLPHSPEHEAALLGAMLLDTVRVMDVSVRAGVNVDWFFDKPHRIAYEAIVQACAEDGAGFVSPLNVADVLRRKNLLEAAGGVLGVDRLVDQCPTAAHAEYDIDKLRVLYRSRSVIKHCDMARARIMDEDEPEDVASSLITDLCNADTRREVDVSALYKRDKAVRAKVQAGERIGLPSKFKEVQQIKGGYDYEEGECVVITGRSSHGKSMLLEDEIVYWMQEFNTPICIAQLDMSAGLMYRRMAAKIANINGYSLRYGNAQGNGGVRYDAAWEWLEKAPLHVRDFRMNIGEVLSWWTVMRERYGCRVFGLDHLTKIRRTKSEERQDLRIVLGEWVARIQDFGRQHHSLTLPLSQSNTRDSDKYAKKTPPLSGLGSIKESGGIEENADGVIIINKTPDMDAELFSYQHPWWDMTISVAKNRMQGPVGKVPLWLYTARQRFVDRAAGDIEQEMEREGEAVKEQPKLSEDEIEAMPF